MLSRLYWKFFLFFFLAQLTTAFGVGVFILFDIDRQSKNIRSIDHSPIAQSFITAAISTLQLGGEDALKQLLSRWRDDHVAEELYVLRADGKEILSRNVEALLAEDAKNIKQSKQSSLTKVKLENGTEYQFFVVAPRGRHFFPREGAPSPPGLDSLGTAPPFNGGAPPPNERLPMNAWMGLITAFPIKGLLIGTLASIFFAAILAWYFLKPIKNLRHAFQEAASGNLNVQVAEKMGSRNDELSDLGRHFDHMVTRINALLKAEKRLLHHVSHELRSPLARIHMALGLATQNQARIGSSIDRIELEANRMEKLIGELLELSRFESGIVEIKKESFVLNDILETIVEDAALEASAKRIKILLDAASSLVVMGQQDLLYRAIENVVRNAIKYGPSESEIKLLCQYEQGRKWVLVEVVDQGTGVLETELEDIFKPFVRGYSSSQNEGHGVGLAITKQVIEAHGGEVVAKNLKPFGFSVLMKIPTS
ncbi:MAG: ATP-binding protein [Methylophilus sp.]|nr:ATP-binding protein [Methylophilus sp.]